jgi:chemotaxis response regulator CheB
MAQHIHPAQQTSLLAIGHANRGINCSLALGRHWLNPGHLLIVPASCRLKFSRQGELFSTRESWEGPETPGIDQLMLAMSGMRPAPSGAIIFSGAGKDGHIGLGALAAVGSQIWVQQPGSCEAPSMPQAAIDTGLSCVADTPEGLASRFMALYPTAMD